MDWRARDAAKQKTRSRRGAECAHAGHAFFCRRAVLSARFSGQKRRTQRICSAGAARRFVDCDRGPFFCVHLLFFSCVTILTPQKSPVNPAAEKKRRRKKRSRPALQQGGIRVRGQRLRGRLTCRGRRASAGERSGPRPPSGSWRTDRRRAPGRRGSGGCTGFRC